MHRGDDDHGEDTLVDGLTDLAEERGCKVAAELAKRLVYERLCPYVRAKDVGEEPLNGCNEALNVGQVIPPVHMEEVGGVSA